MSIQMKAVVRILLTIALGAKALGVAAAPAPGMMKAIQYAEFGPSSVLKYVDVARPEPAAGEVLVRVHAAGVNPIDRQQRHGRPGAALPKPLIPGYDFAGEIAALGAGVSGPKLGEHVFGMLPLNRPGAYAQYLAVPAGLIARMPNNLDYVHAAAVPLAALTAYQALFDTGALKSGQRVLIHGAAGGVGHFAIQLARDTGAKVFGTASESNLAFITQLGADTAIDYHAQAFDDVAQDIDLVFDTVGGDTLKRSYDVVQPGGTLVSIAGQPDASESEAHGIHGVWILVKPDAVELGKIAGLIEQGLIRPELGGVYALKDAALAHDQSETRHLRGKLVLRVD
jgi:NADPH:quinone reductase-like Zn-dependent oxidoreductase